MIRYSKDSFNTVFYWWGGINRDILPKALIYLVYVACVYVVQIHFPDLGLDFYSKGPAGKAFHDSLKGILSFLVFLLVFRLNQCMSRHYAAVALVTDLFTCLERLTVDFCTHLRSDSDHMGHPAMSHAQTSHPGSYQDPHTMQAHHEVSPWERSGMALAAKINCIRLIIAYAVSVVLHFQLLDACSDNNGELDDVEVQSVVFIYCRLRCLLYDEEMHLIDHSLSILRHLDDSGEPTYRTEVNRFRLQGESGCEQLIGHAEQDRCPSGVTVVPVPKIIMNILMRALQKPADQPWGYESRLWNLFWRTTLRIVEVSGHLESIINSPTPLPYLQHCRMLFLVFALAFPLSMDVDAGVLCNIVLPVVIFWAIMGFEVLSASLENPLGNDEVDMNLFEKIHSLEVNAEQIFDATGVYEDSLKMALTRTEGLVMGTGAKSFGSAPTKDFAEPKPEFRGTFRTYFRWSPIPTAVLSDLLSSHGEVESLHSLRLNIRHLISGLSLRKMLRLSLNRPRDEHSYVRVESTDTGQDATSHPVDLNKDPNYFCHYIEFLGAVVADEADVRSMDSLWVDRAKKVLSDHPASRLVTLLDEDDSDRSLMMQGRTSNRMLSMMARWEKLA